MTKIRTAAQLAAAGFIGSDNIEAIKKVAEKFSVSLTPTLVEILETGTSEHREAISRQFLSNIEELNTDPDESKDPIGDKIHEKVKGLVHRYPDRCLLMPIQSCPVHCRFCFRRETVGQKNPALTREELQIAYDYIASDSGIWEVILTGGDPLILKPKKIAEILGALASIPHVEVIRIHSRVPVIDPGRITKEMIQALKINKAVYIAVHANHTAEFTESAKLSIANLVDAGIPLLGQTVLLKGVNDSPAVMGELMRTFVKNRIKPYYLHHVDLAEGISHFRTTIAEGRALMKSMRGNYSGLCQPTYVLDIPGGHGKVPISSYPYFTSVESDDDKELYCVEDYQGKVHHYKS